MPPVDSVIKPYAITADQSRGREHAETIPRHVDPFALDRQRVLHSAAFRRLDYKTQVFGDYGLGDIVTNRLLGVNGLGDIVTSEHTTTQNVQSHKHQENQKSQWVECESCYKYIPPKDLREVHYSLKIPTKSRKVCERCYHIEKSEYECCAYCGLNSYGCSPCSQCKMD